MSTSSRKICVVTGTRAEYGLLRWVMQGIQDSDELDLQLIVTGMHLSPEFGLTISEIEADEFCIDRKVEMLLSSDTPVGITKSMGLSVVTLFISGFLIDKFTSRKLLIYMNVPLFFLTVVLFYFDIEISSFFFFGLLGITNGLANVLGSSTWAEIYGVKHIGSIKALTTALMVFATAFGTALFGILIDINFSIEQIAIVSGAYILTSIILLYLVRSKLNPQYM